MMQIGQDPIVFIMINPPNRRIVVASNRIHLFTKNAGIWLSIVFSLVLLTSLLFDCKRAWAENPIPLSNGQVVYVPIYSHIYSGDRQQPLYLSATLSVRNTDPAQSIKILSVDYFDTEGQMLKSYIKKPIGLKPLESTRFVVAYSDKEGGSGANFIVKWASDKKVNPPLIESVMIGAQNQLGISFTSRGQVLQTQ